MTERQLVRIRAWWHKYVRRFDKGDGDIRRNMRLKESHTLRVCREALSIGRALKISQEDLRITEALVLLHDVGRFVQYARYRTFADSASENHALLSLKIISRERVLSDLAPGTKSIIRGAIRFHNRAEIPPVRNRRLLFFSRLMRDADKLDIWRLVIGYYYAPPGRKNHAISVGLPDAPGVTAGVMEDVRAGRIVASRNVKTLNDFKLLQLGWVFDVNFEPTLRAIERRAYMEKIRDVLPPDGTTTEAYSIVRGYVRERLNGKAGSMDQGHLAGK
jgi:hypothetical protein